MIKTILNTLQKAGVENYIITKIDTSSYELFFVKTRLDLSRVKEVCYYTVTVYIDSEDKQMRGCSTVTFDASSTSKEIMQKVLAAVSSAKNSFNPFYELPEPETASIAGKRFSLAKAALKLGNAIISQTSEVSFVNSAEVFAVRKRYRIISSKGTDVSFGKASFNGEFVVQCKSPQDVELHDQFEYDSVECAALSAQVSLALTAVAARANATEAPRTGTYRIVLGGKHISTLMDFYIERTDASMIYSGYSDCAEGQSVQGERIVGEPLNVMLKATAPFDLEGVRTENRPLITAGKLKAISGSNRFCRYLGKKPSGSFSSFEVQNGTASMEQLLSGKCLYIVAFSDFQCDSFDGTFGGEIRLAYLYDNGTVTPLTGGSLNGNLLEQQGNMVFSLQRYVSHKYTGPCAVSIADVTISGV